MNAIVREILQGNGTNDDKAKALNELQADIALAERVLSGEYSYCKECDRYYLMKSFQHKAGREKVQICTYQDPINSGGNEYTSGTAWISYEICPCGHVHEMGRIEIADES